MKDMKIEDMLEAHSGGLISDWKPMDGPDSGVGVDYWFFSESTGKQAYVNIDQGEVIMEID